MGVVRRIYRRMPLWSLALIVFVVAYAFFVLFAWVTANDLLFASRPSSYVTLPGLIKIPASDGTAIAAVHLPNPAASFTLLYFHGNAEDLGDIHDRLTALRDHGFAVVGMDYRSYGQTPGQATEGNVLSDAKAVYHHMIEQLGVPAERIVIYGRSLGSGPAVHLAAHEEVGGLIIQSGFISAFRTMTGITLLPWDRFSNLLKMPRVRCPVLVMHGDSDRTVPYTHGQRLFAAAAGPKRALLITGAAHNNFVDVAGSRYWTALKEFQGLLEQTAR